MKILYHALFVDNVNELMGMFPPVHPNIFYHHSTIEFAPKDASNIEVGKKMRLQIVGRITTDRVDALIVANLKSKNRHPHITLSTALGVKPFESNTELEKHPALIKVISTPQYIDTTEGYMDGTNTKRVS